MQPDDDLMTLGELAERLKLSGETLRKLLRDGLLVPTLTIGHSRRFSWMDIQRQFGHTMSKREVDALTAPTAPTGSVTIA